LKEFRIITFKNSCSFNNSCSSFNWRTGLL